MKKEKKGFTLIELLVVIAIIGLLSTLSIIALNTARARARDAKRLSDVRQIQMALEMVYNDDNEYPASISTSTPIENDNGDVFLRRCPSPPQPADGGCDASEEYTYDLTPAVPSTNTPASYTVSFCLGSDVNDVDAGDHNMTPAGIE